MYTWDMPKRTEPDVPIEVGITTLRGDLPRWIEAAQHHDVVITNRGMPVARLVAIGEHPGFERLIERGLVRLPTRPARHLDVRDLVQAHGSVSDLVAEQRR
jgi:prevent-host-death family protein